MDINVLNAFYRRRLRIFKENGSDLLQFRRASLSETPRLCNKTFQNIAGVPLNRAIEVARRTRRNLRGISSGGGIGLEVVEKR